MPGTTLQDVIVPELFTPYVLNRTMELSALFNSGIVTNNAEFDALASQASPLVTMPFFEDLTGESEQVIEGADPMKAIGDLVAQFWARDMQKELIAILNGVFGTIPEVKEPQKAAETRLASNLLDISGNSGNAANWSGSAFIDAEQKLGDAKAQLTGICMHSATEAYLKKQNLIETVQPSNDVAFGTYQGKRVIIDDGCPYDSKTKAYTTYLFGNGAVALGNGNPEGFVPTETDRAKRKGSGVDYLINRRTTILHPRGIAFTNANVAKTEGPSRVELADPANWNPVYEPKQIRIVAFKHKLG